MKQPLPVAAVGNPPAEKKRTVSLTLWQEDESLADIGEQLSITQNAVLSLDFFDTLVGRLCNEPTDVFTHVGDMLTKSGILPSRTSRTEFRELRKAAEQKARQNRFWSHGTTEITLADIYTQLSPAVITDPVAAAKIEVEAEAGFCFINPHVESLMHCAISLGHRVCVLSDMYLSSNHLIQIAAQNGLDTTGIQLVATSSEHGNGKTSGYLFRLAMKTLDVPAQRLFHLGDNKEADVDGPKKAGVRGFHYYRTQPDSEYIYAVENRFQLKPNFSWGINAVRTLTARRESATKSPYVHAGSFLLGPALSHWADWCVAEMEKEGIHQVFAFMREGRLVRQLLEQSAAAMNVKMNIRELYVSRQATHLASVGPPAPHAIAERIYARTVGEILDSFGMHANEIGFPPHISAQPVQSVEMLQTLVKFLSSGNIKQLVEQKSATARSAFMAYFTPFLTEKKFAVVDLGWAGTIQRNISRILQLEGIDAECHGYYLATSAAAANTLSQHSFVHGYLSNFGQQSLFTQTLVRSPEIIEQTVSAPVGSTIGYRILDGGAEPILDKVQVNSEEQSNREAVQKGILAYQQVWLQLARRKQLFTGSNESQSLYDLMSEDICSGSAALIHRLIGYPTRNEAVILGGFHHDDGLHSNSVQPIAAPAKQAILENDGYFKMMISPKTYWPQGVLAQSDETLVSHLACGTEHRRRIEEVGKIENAEALCRRHPSVRAEDIVSIRIEADDWLYYHTKIRCPECYREFEEKTVGTYTVIKTVGCPHCGHLVLLNYDAVQAYFDTRHPNLQNTPIIELENKTAAFRKDVNFSFSTPGDVPLLATIGNSYVVSGISKMVCSATIRKEESR